MSKIDSNAEELKKKFDSAIAFHQSGMLREAASLYENILSVHQTHAQTLHLLGLIKHQQGNHHEAAKLIQQAIALNNHNPQFHLNYAVVLQHLGNFEAAILSCNHAINLDPHYSDAYYNRGLSQFTLERFPESIESFDHAIILRPERAEYHGRKGLALAKIRHHEAAEESYELAIQLNPENLDFHNNLGLCLKDAGKFKAAIKHFLYASHIDPKRVDIHHNLGNAFIGLENYEAAVAHYDQAIELNPNFVQAYNNKGNALQELGDFEAAILAYRKALELNPNHGDAHNNLGAALLRQNQPIAALASLRSAIAINPLSAGTLNNLANALFDLGNLDAAIEFFRKAILIEPGNGEAHLNLGNAFLQLGYVEEALASYLIANNLAPYSDYSFGTIQHIKMKICEWENFDSNQKILESKIRKSEPVTRPWAMIGLTDSPQIQQLSAQLYSKKLQKGKQGRKKFGTQRSRKKISIGYYSSDFHDHATARLISEVFELHDKSRFEVYHFSFGPETNDEMQTRIKNSSTKFIDVTEKSDQEVAKLSIALGIDIAIDLKGYTQNHRAGIFMEECAPIQVNFLGYPGTLGSGYIDYILADKVVIPEHLTSNYSEMIAYLPGCYQPNDSRRNLPEKCFTRKEFGLPEDKFVFCSFNNSYKLLPPTFDLWMRILREVEGSVLWLLEDNQKSVTNLCKEAELRGVSSDRLIFAKRIPADIHLSRHQLADLFLDTYPCNAHTTASDALWAGLPLVTRTGETFASRVAGSLLTALDLEELITTTPEEYFALAIELSANRSRLEDIKNKLEAKKHRSALFSGISFAKNLESAYSFMLDRHQEKLSPQHFEILQDGRARLWQNSQTEADKVV